VPTYVPVLKVLETWLGIPIRYAFPIAPDVLKNAEESNRDLDRYTRIYAALHSLFSSDRYHTSNVNVPVRYRDKFKKVTDDDDSLIEN
jgi:hypothetical protein